MVVARIYQYCEKVKKEMKAILVDFSRPQSWIKDQEEMLWSVYVERGSVEEGGGRAREVGGGRCEYIQCPPSLLPPDNPGLLLLLSLPRPLIHLVLLRQSNATLEIRKDELYSFEKTGICTT
jgi:hypothetical protein